MDRIFVSPEVLEMFIALSEGRVYEPPIWECEFCRDTGKTIRWIWSKTPFKDESWDLGQCYDVYCGDCYRGLAMAESE